MRRHRQASVILVLLAALGECSAALRSYPVAITLTARVAPMVRIEAGTPTAQASDAAIVSTAQDSFTLVFTVMGKGSAVIQIPVTVRSNVNDVLLRATVNSAGSGTISIAGGEVDSSRFVSRPTPFGIGVTFAIASDLVRRPVVPIGSPLPATISIVMPPGSVAWGERIVAKFSIEPLNQ